MPAVKQIPASLFMLGILGWLLVGCVSLADPESAQVYYPDVIGSLTANSVRRDTIGQSFTPRRSHLDGITLWLSSAADEGEATFPAFLFQLFSGAEPSGSPVYQAAYRLPGQQFEGPFRITFPAQKLPEGHPYYVLLSPMEGSIRVMGRMGDFYPLGQAQVSGERVNGDLAFSLTYQYGWDEIRHDLYLMARWFWIALPLGVILILPGWLLLDSLHILDRFRSWERLALSSGLSLAIIPVLMFWSSAVGLQWNTAVSFMFAGFLLLLSGFQFYLRQGWKRLPPWQLSDLVLAGVMLGSLFLRVAMVRDLSAPPWVDSVHHALIVRLIQGQGGIPETYDLNLNISSTAYHPGYHTGLALFQWLSKIELPEAMLIYGQALNWLAVLAAYLFAVTITKKPWVGVCSALAAGLLLPLPAYLTSWGRYTHLAGLIIFPALVALSEIFFRITLRKKATLDLSPSKRSNRFSITLALALMIGVAGLSLVHYRVAGFLGIWWLAYTLGRLPAWRTFFRTLRAILILAGGGGLLIAPWAFTTIRDIFLPRLPPRPDQALKLFSDFDSSLLTAGSGWLVLLAAGAGILIFSFQKPRKSLCLAVWIALMFLLANLNALGLPGGNFINNLSVEITLYLPISLLFGYAVVWLKAVFSKTPLEAWGYLHNGMVVIGLVGLAIFGFIKTLPILNPATVLAHRSDLEAIQWINQNMPEQATFLINPYPWGYGLCTGGDGGYWITPLTGNVSYPPPVLYGFSEPAQVHKILTICEETRKSASQPALLRRLMVENEIRYVYLGSKGGVLNPALLQTSGYFKLVYSKNGVWIFEIQSNR